MVLGRARPDERRRRRRLRLLRITPQALKAPTWESLGCSFFYLLPRPRAPPRGRHHPPGLPGGTAGSTWSAALASPSRNSPPPYIWSRGPSRKKKSWAGGACRLLNQNLGRVLPKFGSKSGAKVKSGAVKTGPYSTAYRAPVFGTHPSQPDRPVPDRYARSAGRSVTSTGTPVIRSGR